MIKRHYSAERQTAKQTLTTSKNSIEFTYSNFPCHVKVNRDKLALINRLWKCKKGRKIDDNRQFMHENRLNRWIPPAVAVRIRKFRPL